ncbi:MAG: hypothetical protein JW717_02100 [Marinilabiliaceae bacterium]|nr:hypothetical protein [Marinilabiliaceae bacterium]
MRIILFVIIIVLSFVEIKAQNVSVEKSVWGIQLGIYPLSGYNELRLTNNIAIRSEIGFSYGWSGGSGYNGTSQWAATPDINIEPRFYYNLNRRSRLEKRIDSNSGNYLSLNVGYGAGALSIKSDNTTVYPSVHIIPMYGLRRKIGNNFNFEFAFGIGYGWIYKEYQVYNFYTNDSYLYKETDNDLTYGIRLAIGFVF